MSTTIIDSINNNHGITCVGFMGGAQDVYHLLNLAICVRNKFPDIKIGWYTGQSEIPEIISENLEYFDYIKIGPYIKDKGGLDNPNTNQIMYKVNHLPDGNSKLENITYKFWKNGK
jgi:anaerobic ribonucleoside-triphosphate reductase activating protein